MTALEEAIASGQVSPAQIEAHRAAGDLPIVMFEPRFQHTYCSQCGRDCGPGDEGFSSCGNHIADISKLVPKTLREIIDGAPPDAKTVFVSIADLRAALDDSERYKYAIHELGAYTIISAATDWFRTHTRAETPYSKASVDLALNEAIKGAQS